MFIPLYPIGFIAEWLCYYIALPYLKEQQLWTIRFPNNWNFGWDFVLFVKVLLGLYFPLAPMMFGGMMKQRKKKLGREGREMEGKKGQ